MKTMFSLRAAAYEPQRVDKHVEDFFNAFLFILDDQVYISIAVKHEVRAGDYRSPVEHS